MVEAAIAPRSTVVGRTLAELDFQDRYGLVVLAIWRGGKPIQNSMMQSYWRDIWGDDWNPVYTYDDT